MKNYKIIQLRTNLNERTKKRTKELKHYLEFPSNCYNLYFVEKKPYDIRHRLKRHNVISERMDLSFGGRGLLHWLFKLNRKWRKVWHKKMCKMGLDGRWAINSLYRELQNANLLYIYRTLDTINGRKSLNIYVVIVDGPPEGIFWNKYTFSDIIKSCVENNRRKNDRIEKDILSFEIEQAFSKLFPLND